MLPFLDILFATVAIFVVVMLVQRIVRVEALPYRVDALLVCPDSSGARLYPSPHSEPTTIVVERTELVRALGTLVAERDIALNVLVGIGAGCLDRLSLFEEVRIQLETASALGGNQRLVRIVTIPAEPPKSIEAELLARWRSTDDVRNAR